MYRIKRHVARGLEIVPLVNFVTSLDIARRSCCLISYKRESAWNWTISEDECKASCTSFTHLLTTSGDPRIKCVPGHIRITGSGSGSKCLPATRADEDTIAFLSTIACLMYLSIAPSMVASILLQLGIPHYRITHAHFSKYTDWIRTKQIFLWIHVLSQRRGHYNWGRW